MIGNAIAGLYGEGAPPAPLSSYESIATASPSGVSTVTFSSIPSTFKHLQIRFNLIASAQARLGVQVNADTSSAYPFHYISGNGTTVAAGGSTSGVLAALTVNFNARTDTSFPSVGVFDLLDYSSSTKNKVSRTLFGMNNNGASAGYVDYTSSLWSSTAVVSSLSFLINSGTYTGSIALYGIKGE